MKVRSFSNYLLIWRREIAVSDELCPNSRLILKFFGKCVLECDAGRSFGDNFELFVHITFLVKITFRTLKTLVQRQLLSKTCYFRDFQSSKTKSLPNTKIILSHHREILEIKTYGTSA